MTASDSVASVLVAAGVPADSIVATLLLLGATVDVIVRVRVM